MAYDAKTERLIALKKLAGKAQTSNDKGLANEALPSGITSTSETIFGETAYGNLHNAAFFPKVAQCSTIQVAHKNVDNLTDPGGTTQCSKSMVRAAIGMEVKHR